MVDETETVKKRRLTKADHRKAKEFVFDIRQTRKANKFRRMHEETWKEVDRQIQMQPPRVIQRSGNTDEDWHNAIQLGLLADALEILSADSLRLMFPSDRTWFAPHVETGVQLDEQGNQTMDRQRQKATDGVLRSLMSQQHMDFGFKQRVKLSIKEALTHGGFITETLWVTMAKFHGGSGVESLSAPVWQPHSMWNTYPDHSESVIGTDLIYRGSTIIESHMPMSSVKRRKGWINLKDIKKKDTDEVKVVTFYGDLVIARSRGENIFLPNRKTIFVEDTFVFSEINETPYSPIIYSGYERDDVRDPYYTSPLIKRAPTAKMATGAANGFLDLVDLKREPPIVYEKHDTFYAANDGPDISPGSKNPTTGASNLKIIETGDPLVALEGMRVAVAEVEKGTGSNAIRQGVTSGNELTATEIVKAEQRGELRTVDFVGVVEAQGLRPFLYMQHGLNLKKLKDYPVYNDEVHTPDFIRMSASDLNKRPAHFEITGSRALLGEEMRVARFRDMASLVLSSEVLAQRSDIDEILKQGWDDARVKDPSRFLLNSDPTMEQKLGAMQQQFEQQLQQMQAELERFTLIDEKHQAEKEALQLQIERAVTDANTFRETNRILMETRQAEDRMRTVGRQVQADANSEPEDDDSNRRVVALEKSVSDLAKLLADLEEQRRSKQAEIMGLVGQIDPEASKVIQ